MVHFSEAESALLIAIWLFCSMYLFPKFVERRYMGMLTDENKVKIALEISHKVLMGKLRSELTQLTVENPISPEVLDGIGERIRNTLHGWWGQQIKQMEAAAEAVDERAEILGEEAIMHMDPRYAIACRLAARNPKLEWLKDAAEILPMVIAAQQGGGGYITPQRSGNGPPEPIV